MAKSKPLREVSALVIRSSLTTPCDLIDARELDRRARTRGMLKIGFHYVVPRDGRVELGRPVSDPGVHTPGFNHRSVGICLVGGVDDQGIETENFTEKQLGTLGILLIALLGVFPAAEIHKRFGK